MVDSQGLSTRAERGTKATWQCPNVEASLVATASERGVVNGIRKPECFVKAPDQIEGKRKTRMIETVSKYTYIPPTGESGYPFLKMIGADHITTLLLTMVQLLTGVVANGIIMTVNAVGLIKQRKTAALDLLLLCLASSRLFLQLYLVFALMMVFSVKQVSIIPVTVVILLFTNEVGLWFATWLGVFYCVKIATIPHPFFLWLKMRISRLVPWLIVGSLLHSAILSAIQGKYAWAVTKRILGNFFFKNTTQPSEIVMPILQSFLFITNLTLPFLIFLTAVGLLIFFLVKHTERMRTMGESASSPGQSAHTSAVLSVLSFLVLYVSHYLVAIFFCTQNYRFGSLFFFLCVLVGGTYPSVHSIILIFVNPKLKQNVKTLLLSLRKCCP
ncbi:taste receptor type 2 member 1 [Perognathus longimembris pacificus]|uniref:taste receptor type 2 member 1 n=1 Tax=Perognathus longimembris pacificus TaxID=214514 RepID=UPI002018D93B|nr:taste receptor type 2 member 1 [Perognathus longimembris pacificus]